MRGTISTRHELLGISERNLQSGRVVVFSRKSFFIRFERRSACIVWTHAADGSYIL